MNSGLNIRTSLLVSLLLAFAASSVAASLGRLRGAVILGRALDVSVTVQLDAGQAQDALCATADVFMGDTRVTPARLNVSTVPGASSSEVLVRVRTTSVVDEPVVTVYLSEGCAQKTSRKYVMLADVLADTTSAQGAPLVVIAPASPSSSLPVVPAAGLPSAAPVDSSGGAAASSATKLARARKSQLRGLRATSAPAQAPAVAAPAPRLQAETLLKASGAVGVKKPRARLKLDPLDLLVERDPSLRASTELLTAPSTDESQRQAAAALWQALNAQPQDVLRDGQRLKGLERDVATLMAQDKKTQQAVADMSVQLDRARGERYRNWLVYLLAGLLALALALALWFWRSAHTASSARAPWWRKDAADEHEDFTEPPQHKPAAQRSEPKPVGGASNSSLDVDLGVDESLFESLKRPGLYSDAKAATSALAERDRADFLPSISGMPRPVNAEELFDVQQQADFFVTLGQFDQAIEVLRHHITDNVETSALAYLDLFELYHRLSRTDDYEELRKDFNRVFNAQVPRFEEYMADTGGLECYPAALSRIEALWPTARVLEAIEESIFRKPDASSEVFNLTAYRELLILYSVAKDIVEMPSDVMDFELSLSSKPPAFTSQTDSLATVKFASTTPAGLSVELAQFPALPDGSAPDVDLTQPPPSLRLGLDIDLNSSSPPPPAPATRKRSVRVSNTDVASDPSENLIEFDVGSINARKPWPKDDNA